VNRENLSQASAVSPQLLRRLSIADLDAILALQSAVGVSLPSGFVRFKDETELVCYLNGDLGAAVGIFDKDELSATALVRIPSVEHPNRLEPFPRILPQQEWTLHTAILENAMVAPKARGRGYQRALLDARVAHARAAGMKWIGGGARLNNLISWRNMLARGMTIVGMRFHEGHAFVGLLQSFESVLCGSFTDFRLVPTENAAEHVRALDAGYVGTQLASSGIVIYQRCLT
jgi:GNAT superfamily N-acetyltransferase